MLVMPTKIIDCEQNTDEWFQARLGRVTSSRIADIMAKSRDKKSWGASRATYEGELVAERDSQTVATGGYQSAEMRWGSEQQPEAEKAYKFFQDCDLERVGFVSLTEIMAGASPDALVVGEPGLVEFKCPNQATHLDTLLREAIPDKYVLQMQWQMFCTGRIWCDYVSFDPRFSQSRCLYVQRVRRDEKKIIELVTEVRTFLSGVEFKLRQLHQKYPERRAA